MNRGIIFFIVAHFMFYTACSQSNKYDVKNYREVKRGEVEIDSIPWPNSILYVHKSDDDLTAIFTFEDSLFTKPSTRFYYFKGKADGPFETINDGVLLRKGTYKNGKLHGEKVIYKKGRIAEKQYYTQGIKTGTWLEYANDGTVIKTTQFDSNGNVIRVVIHK